MVKVLFLMKTAMLLSLVRVEDLLCVVTDAARKARGFHIELALPDLPDRKSVV